jgi:hypothetical protein
MLDNANVVPGRNKTLRCAIYTRKSHEEGLEQEFNSLDAQRESAEAYIESQRMQGFRVKAPVTRRPPHRSVREDFPHTVPRFRFFYQIFNQTGDTPFGV